MADKQLVAPFGRMGGKARLRATIYKFFPKEFKTYVEAFVGGGSVMMGYKFKPEQKVVINDLDKKLISSYRTLKKGPTGNIEKYNTKDMADLNRFRDKPDNSDLGRLVAFIVNSRNTFGNLAKGKLYKAISPYDKLKKLPEYKEKLKNVTILNQQYSTVLNKYDNPNTFFYLDPPYENSTKLYEKDHISMEALAKRLKTLKGKFMLSINDSKNIRNLFKGFKMRKVTTGAIMNSTTGPGKASRSELIITNY